MTKANTDPYGRPSRREIDPTTSATLARAEFVAYPTGHQGRQGVHLALVCRQPGDVLKLQLQPNGPEFLDFTGDTIAVAWMKTRSGNRYAVCGGMVINVKDGSVQKISSTLGELDVRTNQGMTIPIEGASTPLQTTEVESILLNDTASFDSIDSGFAENSFTGRDVSTARVMPTDSYNPIADVQDVVRCVQQGADYSFAMGRLQVGSGLKR